MRREQETSDLLRAAEATVAAARIDDDRTGLVHASEVMLRRRDAFLTAALSQLETTD